MASACTNKRNVSRSDGGVSTPEDPASVVVSLPVVTSISPASPSSDETPNLQGTADSGTGVRVYLGPSCGGSPIGQSTAAQFSAGNLSITLSEDTTSTFSIKGYSSSGTTSLCGSRASYIYTEDSTAPASLTISSPASSPYTSGSTALNISGTCETGATVRLSGDASTSVTCTGGTFSTSVTKVSDGTYNFSLLQSDAAGNSSASSSLQWVLNSSMPPNVVVTSPASSPIINAAGLITISGTCVAGYTVRMSGDHAEDTTCTGGGTSHSLILNHQTGLTTTPLFKLI